MPDKPPALAKRGTSLARLETAFQEFDVDESGTISAANLEAILLRPTVMEGRDIQASRMSKEDVAEIIQLFDADGNGTLDLLEFEAAMSMFGQFLSDQKAAFKEEQEVHQNAALSACIAPHAKAVKDMFSKFDEDKTGYILPKDGTLAKDVLIFYYEGMGFDFTEELLVAWNKAHNEGDKPGLSLDTFGKFLAELAHCDDAVVGGAVEAFGEAVEYIEMKRAIRQGQLVTQLKADLKAAGSKPDGDEDSAPRKLKQSGSKMFAKLARAGSSWAL